jgi:hypothetical protein
MPGASLDTSLGLWMLLAVSKTGWIQAFKAEFNRSTEISKKSEGISQTLITRLSLWSAGP